MSQPLISVIVPVYKVEKYLVRCVESIRSQTHENLEIILVNDGSPDRCGEMCDALAAEDSRIRVVHKENGGLSSARNAGLDVMTGDYVGFVDSDDYIVPDMYESLLALMDEHGAQIACGGIERVTDTAHVNYFNENLGDLLVLDREQAMQELLRNIRVTNSACDKLFSKAVFDGLRMTEGVIYEDMDVMYRCIYRTDRVVYTGKPVYCYYLSDRSILRGNMTRKHYDMVKAGKKRLAFYREHCPSGLPLAKSRYVEEGLDLIYRSRNASDCDQERKQLEQEIRQMLKSESGLPFSNNTKLKIAFFKLGTPVYLAFLNLFYKLRK